MQSMSAGYGNYLVATVHWWAYNIKKEKEKEEKRKGKKKKENKPSYVNRIATLLVKIADNGLNFYFYFLFYFIFLFFSFLFLFLEQLGLGVISHAVTSVTTWWRSHKTDHRI